MLHSGSAQITIPPQAGEFGATTRQVIALLQCVAAIGPAHTPRAIDLDFSNVAFLNPFFVAPLHCLIHHLRSNGSEVNIVGIQPRLESYASIIGLGNMEDHFGSIDLQSKYLQKSYLPIVSFPAGSGSRQKREKILTDFSALIESKAAYRKKELGVIQYIVEEITDNIVQHSQTDFGFVFYQIFSSLHDSPFELAVIDAGRSVLGSYQQAGMSIASDAEALRLAIRGNSTKSKERGFGISTSVEIVRQLGGEVIIISGNAIFDGTDITEVNIPGCRWPGTMLLIKARRPPDSFNLIDHIG